MLQGSAILNSVVKLAALLFWFYFQIIYVLGLLTSHMKGTMSLKQ